MSAPTVINSTSDFYRVKDDLGIWPHRGKVAAVGIGHSPTDRRWDGDPQHTVGAWVILAIRKAIEDAGIKPEEVDGLVFDPITTTGAAWPEGDPIPQDFLDAFENTAEPFDGLAQLSAEWILKNVPELTGLKTVWAASGGCMSMTATSAIEAVGRGLTKVCLAVKGWHNFAGRYYQNGPNVEPTVAHPGKYGMQYAGPAVFSTASQFDRYLWKYGKTHDMMAPFIVNSRANGLLFPEGYWAQHRPDPLTTEDYLSSRWIAKPANLLDNDMPIQAAVTYVFTTAERAKDMKQKPVYVLGHAGTGIVGPEAVRTGGIYPGQPDYNGVPNRGTMETLEETMESSKALSRRLFEATGLTAKDVQFENFYDGFPFFHVFWIEGFGFAGIKEGEALDFFQTDISIHGPNPVSPSGGNIGGGRTRFWKWTDTIQQLQGRAGARQIDGVDAQTGVVGGFMPFWSNVAIFSKNPE